MSIISIGKCDGCNKMRKLDGGACEICLKYLGKNVLRVFKRARTEPEFRKLVFNRIDPAARDRFIQTFGEIK